MRIHTILEIDEAHGSIASVTNLFTEREAKKLFDRFCEESDLVGEKDPHSIGAEVMSAGDKFWSIHWLSTYVKGALT